MSLHARIAVASSRRVELLSRGVAFGGLALVVATCVARWQSSWPLWLALAGCGLWVATTRRDRPVRERALLVVDDRLEVDVHPRDGGPVEHRVLDEDSVAWPGLAALRLVPATFAAGRARDLVVFDRDLATDDARHLRRWLAWVARGGVPGPSDDRPS